MSTITSARATHLHAYRVKGTADYRTKQYDYSNEFVDKGLEVLNTRDFDLVVCARNIQEVYEIMTLTYAVAGLTITSVELLGTNVLMEEAECEEHNGQIAF